MLRTLMLCAALTVTACASTAPSHPTPEPTAAPVAKNALPPPCLATATRLPPPDCTTPGRSYDQDDIKRTGQTDVASALQMLDPAVTAGH